jgi:hypothetical protein
LPDVAEANEKNITRISECSDSYFTTTFSSGLSVLTDVNTFEDPAATWEGTAKDEGQLASTGTISGVPVLFIKPSQELGAAGSVSFVVEPVWTVVVGNGKLPLAALQRVATSLITERGAPQGG